MLQAACATVALVLLLAACGSLRPSLQAADAGLIGDYRMDCESVRAPANSEVRLRKDCDSHADKFSIKVRQDDSGQWAVMNLADQPSSDFSEWKRTVFEGNACIGAPFVALCKVPLNTPVLSGVGGDIPISSRTGYVFVSQGLIANLIKVESK